MFRIILISFVLFSCSANYHLNKAIKKGAKLEKIEVPTFVYDTITDTINNEVFKRLIVRDTIYTEKTLVKYVPKTKWETRIEYRYDYKRFKDSLKHYRVVYSDSLRSALKTARIESKEKQRISNLPTRIIRNVMLFFVFILIVYIVARIIINKLL